MRAIIVTTPGEPEVLRQVQLPVPPARPDDVLIRVAAAGINAADLSQRRGRYEPPPGASPHLGLEVSGEIVRIGKAVAGMAVGDRVVALCNGGGYAEYAAVPAGQVLPLPLGWSLEDGAALPETFFTVMQTLVMRSGLKSGHWVLVHGAAGGVGGAAIITSLILGAKPVAVVSSAEKAAYATGLGAVAAIIAGEEDFVARTLEITSGHGADRIVDLMGGDITGRNVEAAARDAHIVLVSTQQGGGALPFGRLMMKQLTLSGSTLRPQTADAKAAIAARLRTDIWPALAASTLRRPRIRVWPLADAIDAHHEAEARSNYGKILLRTEWGASLTP